MNTTKTWKPTTTEAREIRVYAAEGGSPQSVLIEVGERFNIDNGDRSENIRLISDDPEWNDTDLHDFTPWSSFRKRGVPLTDSGEALIDFFVYERGFNEPGDLRTNVQAHVQTIDGRPRLVKLTGTLMQDRLTLGHPAVETRGKDRELGRALGSIFSHAS